MFAVQKYKNKSFQAIVSYNYAVRYAKCCLKFLDNILKNSLNNHNNQINYGLDCF
jgi:hypothetical protein